MIGNNELKFEMISRSSVPSMQGIVFGPVNYIVHINDLQTRLPLYKYVDDSTEWEVCFPSSLDSQIQRTTTFEAGRCGKHPYHKGIYDYHLSSHSWNMLVKCAHGPHCFRF